MREILDLCVKLDETAISVYSQFSVACVDPEARAIFLQMGREEESHVDWWHELRGAWDAGLVPPLPDEAELLARLRELAADVEAVLPADCAALSTDSMLALAAHLEFYMLDPMFAELIDLIRPGHPTDLREAYARHVTRLVDVIESRQGSNELSHFLARALARSFRDQQRLNVLATHDALTGLYNRRGLYSYVLQWASWAARYERSVSVVIIDVDRFKAINDAYGHPAGDTVLVAVANALQEAVRTSDVVGRYGGDEFAILAPETGRDDLVLLMERILEVVRNVKLDLPDDDVELTVSVGGSYTSDGVPCTPEQLLAAADHGLYEAKAAGRNCAGRPRQACEF